MICVARSSFPACTRIPKIGTPSIGHQGSHSAFSLFSLCTHPFACITISLLPFLSACYKLTAIIFVGMSLSKYQSVQKNHSEMTSFNKVYNMNNCISPPVGEAKQNPTWHPNRSYIQLSTSLVIDSCFPGGNIATATLLSLAPLTIELEGNTDISMDPSAKYWLYFRIRGYRKDRPVKFVLRNANHLRKYLGQTRIRPYMVCREEAEEHWQPLSSPIDLSFTENGQLQGVFSYQSQKNPKERKPNLSSNDLHREKMGSTASTEQTKRGSCYFAMYYPYGHDDLMRFTEGVRERQKDKDTAAYFNEETITYSFERRKISLLTITSLGNIESFSQREPCPSEEIFPSPKDRPCKLKNCPVVLLTARVHPSQTSSSYFIEGLVDFLLSNTRPASILRELFIFQIIPMLNPDGVQHGNFRFDHQLRNLNRYYGQATIEKTPAIRAAEILINFYKNPHEQAKVTEFFQETCPRLFFYADVHGHSSAVPSFIYGNHTDKLEHAIENKAFCKILQQNFLPGGFSKGDSDFSKKNMTSQEKHDEFSKLCSGRVFAGRAESPEQQVFHSYTIQVLPYWEQFSRRRSSDKDKGEKVDAMDYARILGKSFGLSLLDLLDINPQSRFSEAQMQKLRRQVQKQCINEQSRKLLSYKRAQSCNEQASLESAKGKTSLLDRATACLKEYITRWFSNQSYLRNLLSKQDLFKQPKVSRFLKYIQNCKNGQPEITQSPRKPQLRQGGSKAITEPRQSTRQHIVNPKERMIFVCRKERGKVQTRINKQTLQLQHQFLDLLPIQSRFNPNQLQMDFATYKKQSIPKREEASSTDRYQHEILSTIAHQQQRKVAFEVKVKEIVAKRNNSRTQTETITSEPTLSECPSSFPHSFVKKEREKSTPARDCGRPSFIEQFMLKIREQRESANVFLQKYDPPQQLKICKAPAHSSIREQLQQQERKLLPILRTNKIFTMVTEGKEEAGVCRGFQSMAARRKGAREDGLEQAVLKTKKILIAQKKQEIIREQLLKKSQKMSQYKS